MDELAARLNFHFALGGISKRLRQAIGKLIGSNSLRQLVGSNLKNNSAGCSELRIRNH